MQRVTAVALIPLTLWFAASLIALTGSDYNAFIAWLKAPFVAILMVLFLIALFHHMALGLQVVVEDYVHSDLSEDSGGGGDTPRLFRTCRRWHLRHPAHRL